MLRTAGAGTPCRDTMSTAVLRTQSNRESGTTRTTARWAWAPSILTAIAAVLSGNVVRAQPGTFATSGSGCPMSTATDLQLGDDDVAMALDLGFTFPHAGGLGSTRTIDVTSNGYVYLQSGVVASSRCCAPSLAQFANDPPSIAVFGNDLDPSAGGSVFFESDGTTSARVTWLRVPEFGATSAYDLQLQLFADGSFSLSYRNVTPQILNPALVGFSPGGGARIGSGVDLSSTRTRRGAGSLHFELFPPFVGWEPRRHDGDLRPGWHWGLRLLRSAAAVLRPGVSGLLDFQ